MHEAISCQPKEKIYAWIILPPWYFEFVTKLYLQIYNSIAKMQRGLLDQWKLENVFPTSHGQSNHLLHIKPCLLYKYDSDCATGKEKRSPGPHCLHMEST